MDQQTQTAFEVVFRNQRTIQEEIVKAHNSVTKTYTDLDQAFTRVFQRLDELEREIKKRS